MLAVVVVDADALDSFEQLGTKDKFWYDERKYLFKARRAHTGEDWAEVASASIAGRLGLPHAKYDLAEAVGLPEAGEPRGVRSLNFTPHSGRLVLGNELIGTVASSEMDGGYSHRRQFHTPSRVAALLSSLFIETPMGWPSPATFMTAKGVMAGYLLLDVLIGNQDRHEENWGLIAHGNRVFLAPTFDHASSLGRENRDERRVIKLSHKAPAHGIPGYAEKALSQMYDRKDGERLSTIRAFSSYAAFCKEEAKFWVGQLGGLDEQYFRKLFGSIPDTHITDVGREFAIQVLMENKRRLLALKL